MKKTSTKKATPQKPEPELKWLTGDYDRQAAFKFILPYPFLMLCRLMDVKPRDVILDFTDNLSCGSWHREGRDKAKEHLVNYFIAHGYGQQHYTEDDIRAMFKELDAVGFLFPDHAEEKLIDLYSDWRDQYQVYWFEKWFGKLRRQMDSR